MRDKTNLDAKTLGYKICEPNRLHEKADEAEPADSIFITLRFLLIGILIILLYALLVIIGIMYVLP